MGVGSGLGGQFGIKTETVYGTPVTVTTFLPVVKSDLKRNQTYAQLAGLAAGQLLDRASQFLPTIHDAKGTFELEVVSNGFGQLLQTLMGTTVTPVIQGASIAYLQTHTFADPVGKSLTIQVGVPNTAGTVLPYTFQGCKVIEADFSFDINSTSPITSTWTIDAQDVTEIPTLAAASYTTGVRPFVGTDVTIKIGAFGAETAIDGVTKVDVKIPRPMKTNRFYFGGVVKKEPLTNDHASITGTITADFIDKTVLADKFTAATSFSLVIEAKGALIASTYYQTFRITLPGCFLTDGTPVLDGPDVVSTSFPFGYKYDGTNLPKIEYISTDVAL